MNITVKNPALDAGFIVIAPIDPSVMEPVKVYEKDHKTDADKLVDGHPVYALRGVVVVENDHQSQGVFVRIKNLPDAVIPAGSSLRLTGSVSIAHFVNSAGRLGVSITADGVEVL
jgi:hypothetical protein